MQIVNASRQLRSFGLTVGGIFAVLGIFPRVVRQVEPRWSLIVLGGILMLLAVVLPQSLHWPHKGWMAVGNALGWINSRIILGLVFYIVVTPIGVVRRWLGKDSMGRRFSPDAASYRIPRKPRPPVHLETNSRRIRRLRIMGEFLVELWSFLKQRKKFWLLPIVVCLVLLGSLLVFTSGSVIAPFIYTLF